MNNVYNSKTFEKYLRELSKDDQTTIWRIDEQISHKHFSALLENVKE